MAKINTQSGFPDGRWLDDPKTHYWLRYRRFGYFEDATGNELIRLKQTVRDTIAEVRDALAEHNIEIVNVATQEYLDHKNYGNTIGIAIAFKSLEDKAMASILLDCDDETYMI
jgi:hypothetical protein